MKHSDNFDQGSTARAEPDYWKLWKEDHLIAKIMLFVILPLAYGMAFHPSTPLIIAGGSIIVGLTGFIAYKFRPYGTTLWLLLTQVFCTALSASLATFLHPVLPSREKTSALLNPDYADLGVAAIFAGVLFPAIAMLVQTTRANPDDVGRFVRFCANAAVIAGSGALLAKSVIAVATTLITDFVPALPKVTFLVVMAACLVAVLLLVAAAIYNQINWGHRDEERVLISAFPLVLYGLAVAVLYLGIVSGGSILVSIIPRFIG